MSKRANPTLVGGFVVGAAALVVGGLIAFGSGTVFQDSFEMVAHFRSSVAGLDPGAPVRYRGVQVGTVSDIQAVWDENQEDIRIPVTLTLIEKSIRSPTEELERQREDLDPYFVVHRMIQRGLRAELSQDSFLTGKLYVSLDFFPKTQIELIGGTKLPEMPTTDRELDKLKKSIPAAQELIETLVSVGKSLDQLLANARVDDVLAKLEETIDRVDAELGASSGSFQAAMADTSSTMEGVRTEVASVASDLRGFLDDLDGRVGPLSANANATLADAREAIAKLDRVVGQDDTLFYRLADALDEIARAARSIRELADLLERQPEALVTGRDR